MSRRNLCGEASEEVLALRNRLTVQDAQLAAQQTQLMKQTEELKDFQSSLNDALYKLNHETQRSLELEKELRQRSDEYQGQRVVSQNVEMSLAGARSAAKEKEMQVKELQSTMDTISRASEEHKSRSLKLEREKSTLEARTRELEAELRRNVSHNQGMQHRTPSKPRTSSDGKLNMLQKELDDTRFTLSQKEEHLCSVSQRLSQTQSDLVRLENEKASMTKRMELRVTELSASLEEKEAELQMIKQAAVDGCREDELMKRIEEDEAKIAALESMLRGAQDVHRLKAHVKDMEAKLVESSKKLMEKEEECKGLVREKDEALGESSSAKTEIQRLRRIVNKDSGPNRSEPMTSRECLENHSLDSGRTTPSQADETTISYIERLLAAIDRLRSERDSLRRDVHFLESESKFAIESLEAKLSASTEVHRNDVNIASRAKHIIEHLTLVATANAIIVSHLDLNNTQLWDQLRDKDRITENQADRILELETRLDESTSNLQAICSQKDDIQSQLARRELQWEADRQRLTEQHQCTRDSLNKLERQLGNLSRTLENVESERDSLSLQVTNLTSELQSAQQELRAAETRYSTLQFQQLSAMSATEANRVLRDQLKEMEMRVARRTEQIGIHQHDIRRLETNLRLQEERLSEMTAELETLTAQKDAMVEDCADARETRDTALSRVETFEMELEASEAKLEQSDRTIVSLIAAFMQTISTGRETVKKAQSKDPILVEQLNEARALQLTLTKAMEDEKTISMLHRSLEDSKCGLKQMGIALALSRAEAMKAAHALGELGREKGRLDSQVKELLSQIEQGDGHSVTINLELETSRHEAARNATRVTELETRVLEFQTDKQKKENEYRIVTDELATCKERLHICLCDMEAQVAGKNSAEMALEEVKSRHIQELNSLQGRLEATSQARDESQAKLLAAEADKERIYADFATIQQDLEKRSDALQNTQTKDELLSLKQEHEKELSQLRDNLEAAKLDRERAEERVKDVVSSRQQLADELARMHEETHVIRGKLESNLTLLHVELSKNSQELQKSSQESIRLSQELQHLKDSHAQECTEYDLRIQSIETQWQSTEVVLNELRGRMEVVTMELDTSRKEVEAIEKEKECLRENMTNVEAELQRSISLTRYLESQLKECEQSIESLTCERNAMRADLHRSEKSCNAAEVKLSLHSAQHKREMAELQKELDTIRSKPDLAAALAELEERNNEMEELLRKKCAEIEENDDRVLEILKENKKLAAKVESLNRKVQNLQAKLSAAKASMPKADPASSVPFPSAVPPPAPCPVIQVRPSVTAEGAVAPPKTTPISGTLADRKSINRVAPDVTSVMKPKTPERRPAPPLVFKARSPDKRSSTRAFEPENTGQIIGRKRRAPDDFEASEELPPQGFTVDSIPEDQIENRTPRVRRILSGGLTSFTPVRRSQTVQPSPKRASIASLKSSSLIADVTNSPRGMSQGTGKDAKGSWLGRIRRTATHTTPRIVSSTTRSERRGELS